MSTGAFTRCLFAVISAFIFTTTFVAPAVAKGKPDKMELCHLNDEGGFVLLNLPLGGYLGHMMHHEADIDSTDGVCIEEVTYEIGDVGPGGGIVFNVTDGGLHGLEAAPAPGEGEQDPAEPWCGSYTVTGATGTAIGTGAANTLAILDATNGCADTAGIAASVATEYSTTENGEDFNDWFLPSKDELNAMYENIGQGCDTSMDPNCNVGGFANAYYWSSSESIATSAWSRYFGTGGQGNIFKPNALSVRAVRAF